MQSSIASKWSQITNLTACSCQFIQSKLNKKTGPLCDTPGQENIKVWLMRFGIRPRQLEWREAMTEICQHWRETEVLSQREEFQRQLSDNFVNGGFIDDRPFTQTGGCTHAAAIQSHRQGPSAAQLFNPAVVSCNWCHVLPSLREQWASGALTAAQWQGRPKAIVDK